MSLNSLKIISFIIMFLLEGLTTMNGELRCPNILIQKDAKYYLYNSEIAQVPGVNPIMFNNLEEYTEFLEWQRSAGIRCPVLYVQNSYDVQGNRVYKVRPSVSELQGGLPPTTPVPLPQQQQSVLTPEVQAPTIQTQQQAPAPTPAAPAATDSWQEATPLPPEQRSQDLKTLINRLYQ